MFVVLFATAFAGFQHVKTKEGLKVSHKKYYDMAKAFENVMKKDRSVNTCDRDIITIECAEGFVLVDDVPNPYCQFIDEQPVDLICTGVIIGEECYEVTNEIGCPSGTYMDEKKKHGKGKKDIQCNRSDFAPVEQVCPEGFEIIQEKKRDRCNRVTEECELVCPEGTVEEENGVLACFEEIPLLPRCPDGFELADDLEYCVREVERPCDKKDLFHEKSKSKSGLRHLKAIDEKTDIKFKGAKLIKEPKFKVKKDKDDKITHHVVKEAKKDYVVTRLIEKGLCTYEEIVPAIVDVEKIEVDRVEECFEVNEVEPVALACPDGFELQESKFSKAPACVATEIVPPVCPDGTILFEDMCYSPLDRRPVCPVGFRLNAAKDLCEKVDIQPPEYEWTEVRRCVGYDCQAYYDVACQVKEVHH